MSRVGGRKLGAEEIKEKMKLEQSENVGKEIQENFKGKRIQVIKSRPGVYIDHGMQYK